MRVQYKKLTHLIPNHYFRHGTKGDETEMALLIGFCYNTFS